MEREAFPRDKVCGEFLSAEGCAVLRRLGVLDSLVAAGAVHIDACLLSDRRGREIGAALPDLAGAGRAALGVSRARLDAALLGEARRRGAEVRERTEAVAPIVEEGRVVGARVRAVGSRGDGEPVRAPVVVGADGRRSTLQRALFPDRGDPLRSHRRSWFGLKVHLRGRTERLGSRVELHIFDGGYVGLGAVEDDRINLALLVRLDALRACGGSPDRLLRERLIDNPAVRTRIADAVPCAPWKSVGPLRFNIRVPAGMGAIFVGDAAGTIDPFSGEGMANALAGAELAAPLVLGAAARGGLDAAAERTYDAAWRRAFGPVSRRVRLFGKIFERPRLGGLVLALLLHARGTRLLPQLVAATRTGLARGINPLPPSAARG